jgi:aminoglycoside 2''-phosphotransferase
MMEINAAQLEKIRRVFPALEISSIRVNTDGLINDVLIVNEDLVFRLPRNSEWGKKLFANEIKVIELARKYVEIPLPQFEYQADDLAVYRYIRGDALRREDILRLPAAGQEQIARELAAFLKQFHAIPQIELEENKIAQSDVNRSRETWLKLFENVRAELFPLMMPHVRESVSEHFGPILKDAHFMDHAPQLINGDLAPYHIIFDRERQRINGIIDFGTAGSGDAAADFSCLIYNYGESFLAKMAKDYPEIENAIDRARFWAGTVELQWALSGARTKNYWWNLVHLGGARDVKPVGNEFNAKARRRKGAKD